MVDLLGPWLVLYNTLTGESATPSQVTRWDFKGCGLDRGVLFACLSYPDLFCDLPLIDGAVDGVNRLLADGHDVSFVSVAPGTSAAYHKWAWRDQYFPDVPLRLYSSGLCKSELSADVIIDDCPDTQRACLERGMLVYTLRCPYTEDIPGLHIVDSWEYL